MVTQLQKGFLRVFAVSGSIAVVLYLVSIPVWENFLAAVGFETIAAFMAVLSISSLLLHQRGDTPATPYLLGAGFTYYVVIELGGAIEKLFLQTSPIIQKTPLVLTSDIIEMANLGAVILLALLIHNRGLDSAGRRKHIWFAILFVVPLLLSGVLRFSILQNLPHQSLVVVGFLATMISFLLLFGAILAVIRLRSLFTLNGPVRLSTAFLLFAISCIPSMLALVSSSLIWSMAIILQLVAFFVVYLALAPTFMGSLGVPKQAAIRITVIMMLLIVVPFLLTLISESLFPALTYIDNGAYTVSNIGSTCMSAAFAILIYTYAERSGKRYQYPIAFVFSILTVVGLSNMIVTPLLPQIYGETLSSLIVVSLFSIPALIQSIKWLDDKSSHENPSSTRSWILLSFVGGGFVVVLGGIVESMTLIANPVLDDSPLGGAIVLALNAIILGEFTYLAFLVISDSAGKLTVESVSVVFLSLWIIQNILKSIFFDWSAGWWLGEILLMVSLLAGPAIMGYLYLGAFLQAESSGTRAKVYADVLAHDISNHHQAILYALELARLEIAPEVVRMKALGEAYEALADADRLTKNVRRLSHLDETVTQDFQSMDVVVSIRETFDRLTKALRAPDITLNVNFDEGECFILANDLLHDIFQNLFHNAIAYSGKSRVDVEISPIPSNKPDLWEVRVIDFGPGIPYTQRDQLFKRYMEGAKGTGLGLSVVQALTELFKGTVRIEDRVEGDFSQGSAFVLTFPANLSPRIT